MYALDFLPNIVCISSYYKSRSIQGTKLSAEERGKLRNLIVGYPQEELAVLYVFLFLFKQQAGGLTVHDINKTESATVTCLQLWLVWVLFMA